MSTAVDTESEMCRLKKSYVQLVNLADFSAVFLIRVYKVAQIAYNITHRVIFGNALCYKPGLCLDGGWVRPSNKSS